MGERGGRGQLSMGSTAQHSGKAGRATCRETQMDSEHHNLHNPHCPCTLRHVSSEENNGTGRGWAHSLPSTHGAPSPRLMQDRQRHQHHQSLIRGGSYRLRLWETSPRDVPSSSVFGHVSVHRSIPGCPSLIFVCSCSPEICKTAQMWAHSPPWACRSWRLPGRTQAGDEGKKGDPSRRKHQVPAPFPPLQTHTANMSPACNSTTT